MNSHCIEQALKVVPNKQLLVNMVSKRVRQLTAGSHPLIEIESRMGFADIALLEIANKHIAVMADSVLTPETALQM